MVEQSIPVTLGADRRKKKALILHRYRSTTLDVLDFRCTAGSGVEASSSVYLD